MLQRCDHPLVASSPPVSVLLSVMCLCVCVRHPCVVRIVTWGPAASSDAPRSASMQVRKFLTTKNVGMGNLEVAELLMKRSRKLGRVKAESLMRVLQLQQTVRARTCSRCCVRGAGRDVDVLSAFVITRFYPRTCAVQLVTLQQQQMLGESDLLAQVLRHARPLLVLTVANLPPSLLWPAEYRCHRRRVGARGDADARRVGGARAEHAAHHERVRPCGRARTGDAIAVIVVVVVVVVVVATAAAFVGFATLLLVLMLLLFSCWPCVAVRLRDACIPSSHSASSQRRDGAGPAPHRVAAGDRACLLAVQLCGPSLSVVCSM